MQLAKYFATGDSAPLTEQGYQSIATMRSDTEMNVFIRRLMESKNLVCVDDSALTGFVGWYSGDKATQTFMLLENQLHSQSWVKSIDEFLKDKEPANYAPGIFRISYSRGVPVSAGEQRESKLIANVKPGTEVHVVKIGQIIQNRLRVKIQKPAGWISLRHMELGTKFAEPIVKESSCHKFCAAHESEWAGKCKWATKDCSACAECDEVAAPVATPESFLAATQHGPISPSDTQALTATNTELGESGLTAALSEDGYQLVAERSSDDEMTLFVKRFLTSKGMRCTDEGELQGFVRWYSGSNAVQSFEQLNTEIMEMPWVEKASVQIKFSTESATATQGALGLHRITYGESVPVTAGPARQSVIVGKLVKGDQVNVVEIGDVIENRLRVRIEDPAGWMSLKQMKLGMDFAVPVTQVPTELLNKVTTKKTCQTYCSKHKVQWEHKCQWGSNDCSACSECVPVHAQILSTKEVEMAESEVAVKAEQIVAGCNWDCYLKRYPKLRNEKFEAKNGNNDYARVHFIKHGYAAGRNCKCSEAPKSQRFLKIVTDNAIAEENQAAEAEATEVAELIKGCNWACYLDRYPNLQNPKWEEEKGNIDYAKNHYIEFGRKAGKNCGCDGGEEADNM